MLSKQALILLGSVVLILLPWKPVHAEFENLSTSQLEDLLKTLEYDEEYRNDVEPKEDADYYGQYDAVEPQVEEQGFAPPKVRQTETLQHGTPLASSSGGALLPHMNAGGPTKANLPKGGQGGPVLPAYCDPPNPCPIGYSEKDGCIEDFENSSEFSRKYQGMQNCLCDSEHMFNCPMEDNQHKSSDESFLAGFPPSLGSELEGGHNPFLAGNRLPIAAKKGLGF